MEKKYNKFILYGLLIVVIFVAIYLVLGNQISNVGAGNSNLNNEESLPSSKDTSLKTISTGTTGSGDVSIALTPVGVENGELNVEISVNSHSVDLSQFDLTQITELKYNQKTVKPSKAPKMSGHHVNGELVFEVEKTLSSFTITINKIPKVQERIFQWEK